MAQDQLECSFLEDQLCNPQNERTVMGGHFLDDIQP